ncbi:IS4 family transposase [Nitrococcus mobilis]|uniref:Transposase IS4-like domain-containing protein n=1 Tax=Nitrococcus mobilis Nb-231 TaxID=314278 RepID=A4BSI0_9GAMM|nr:IS4 family transposase [Nitrococcus mobilis]EAR21250.1 hypothetical protein NB231_08335 [Nitrococcus mobilis Nb-231]
MQATPTTAPWQRNRINAHRANCGSYSFFKLLTSEALLDRVEQGLPRGHRKRLYPPTRALSLFLAQALTADRSCQNIVNQAAVERLAGGLATGSTHTGGYCLARQRGQSPGLGFPIGRLVGITYLASGALLNAAIGRFQGKGGNEQTLLRSMQESFAPGDILIGDAFFATYFFIAAMQAKGVDILMEQHGSRKRSTDFRHGQHLGPRDHVIVIHKPKKRPQWMSETEYAAAPATLTLRELKAGGKLLVTTLRCPNTAPKGALKALYQSRWHVELDIRHIKETLGMDVLSCKTPDMTRKEIWVYLLAYNLIRLMMVQSARLADIAPRTISFKHCLQLWLISAQQLDTADDGQLRTLLSLLAQQRVGNRPGRIEPRAVKRRPKPFPLLTKPRHAAREEIREKGIQKKLN